MATNFPSSLDTLTNPTSSDSLASPSHSAQHANVNDAVEALQAKVGVDGSAVTSSLDYKVANQGLVLVKTQTIGSGVSSVTVTDAFSSTFDTYRIVICVDDSSAATAITVKFGATASGYRWSVYGWRVNASSFSANSTSSAYCYFGSTSATDGGMSTTDVFTPYEAKQTRYSGNGGYFDTASGFAEFHAGIDPSSTSYTAFTVAPASGTLSGGTIRVYGYNNG